MSTSTPPKPLGKCVICHQETSKQCSGCKQAGLAWMYFCSVDHQKLVWKSHQRVCGQNPFVWPGLNDKEVEEQIELVTQPMLTAEGIRIPLDIYLEEFKAPHPVELHAKCHERMDADPMGTFKRNADLVRIGKYDPNDCVQVQNVICLRSRAFKVRNTAQMTPGTQGINPNKLCRLIIEDPLGYAAMAQNGSIKYMVHKSSWAPWWTEFQHRFFLVVSELGINEEWYMEEKPYICNAIQDLLNFCRHEIAPTHPMEARHIVDGSMANFLNEISGMFSFEETEGGDIEVISPLVTFSKQYEEKNIEME